jgi:fibronectin type 3 domain-containing protein
VDLQAFDVRSGRKILLIWAIPQALNNSTDLTIDRTIDKTTENLATLSTNSTSFIDTTASNSQVANYAVSYVAYEQPQTSQQVVVPTGQASEVIGANGASFTAKAVSGGIQLTWSLPQPAEEYSTDIFRSDTVGTLGKRIARFDSTVKEFVDAAGKPDVYFYTLRWYKNLIVGDPATVIATASDQMGPEAPKSVTVTYDQERKFFTITWSPSVSSDVDHYDVYRSNIPLQLGEKLNIDENNKGGIKPDPNESLDTVTLKYEDSKISAGQTYYYSVLAVDKAGNSSHYQELQRAGRANPFGEL